MQREHTKLIGANKTFVAMVDRIPPLSSCDATVLITGETGTGKEVIAQAIHEGKLTGHVSGENGSTLPGTTVEVSSPQLLGGKRSTTTSVDCRRRSTSVRSAL